MPPPRSPSRAPSDMLKYAIILGSCLLAGLPTPSFGAPTPGPADGGPFFSGTIRSRYPAGNNAMKGVVVTLGQDKDAFLCFDTDLMRVSVAWTGDYLKLGNYMKEISHPQPPEV